MEYRDLFPPDSKLDPNTTYNGTSTVYPHDPGYVFESRLEYINLDQECDNDIATGNGFILDPCLPEFNKSLKQENGIFSTKFGQTLADTNAFINRYKCECGALQGRLSNGLKCPKCGQVCKYVSDNFSIFGWLRIDKYQIIHPTLYKKIESFLGGSNFLVDGKKSTKLSNILNVLIKTDKIADFSKIAKDEPYMKLGMIEFCQRFDEIMSFYLKKNPSKKDKYNDIYKDREKVFIHSIPVFTSLLRPTNNDEKQFAYEATNGMYKILWQLVTNVNDCSTRFKSEAVKIKNRYLYRIQMSYVALYDELNKIISGKKGDFRCLLGGRYTLSSRNVIVQDPSLRIDEITLPIIGLTLLLEWPIKSILIREHTFTPAEAHKIWEMSCSDPCPMVNGIVQSIIDHWKANGYPGLGVLINRNPTISYGGILQMYCVGFTNTYTMAVPLQILKGLSADFDGDVLNILLPVNMTFFELCRKIFNPRNAMYISRNDGSFNTDVSMQRDTLINANTLARCGREYYTKEEIENLEKLLELKKEKHA